MVIKREELERAILSRMSEEAGRFSQVIDSALEKSWVPTERLSISLPSEPSKQIQMRLRSLYQDAGWELKFISHQHYNEMSYSVEVSAYHPTYGYSGGKD